MWADGGGCSSSNLLLVTPASVPSSIRQLWCVLFGTLCMDLEPSAFAFSKPSWKHISHLPYSVHCHRLCPPPFPLLIPALDLTSPLAFKVVCTQVLCSGIALLCWFTFYRESTQPSCQAVAFRWWLRNSNSPAALKGSSVKASFIDYQEVNKSWVRENNAFLYPNRPPLLIADTSLSTRLGHQQPWQMLTQNSNCAKLPNSLGTLCISPVELCGVGKTSKGWTMEGCFR